MDNNNVINANGDTHNFKEDDNCYHDNNGVTWSFVDSDDWMSLQNTARNISEYLERLEGSVDSTYKQMQEKISGIEKEDLDKTEKLLENFQTRWVEKCKETENLRVSLKRATHESTRVNEEYHDMQERVSKLRKQFGQAIDSSVVEIEELSICNNSLSQRIHELETKIRMGDRSFKCKAKDNLDSLKTIIEHSKSDDVTIKSIQAKLKKEADKIDRMIVVESLFDVDSKTGGSQTSSLAEKSQKMVDAISQGLVETLKNELHECRNINETQLNRIKQLEREKEEFLENQLALQNRGITEMTELFESLRRSIHSRKINSSSENDPTTGVDIVKRNIESIHKFVQNIKGGLDKSYKVVSCKTNEINELKDHLKEVGEKVKEYANQIENLQEEKQFFKTKLDHSESHHRLTTDELQTIQSRLKQVDQERKSLFDENLELKGGKENMQDFCSNLSGENDKLLKNLKTLQDERDKLFEDLQEQMERVSSNVAENNELENQNETLQNVVAKIRREYQDQTRELNILTRENDDMKRTLQDNEQDRMKLKRSVKAVETGNKDLEDQIFQLTNDLQKLKHDHKKLTENNNDNKTTIAELTDNLTKTNNENNEVKTEFNDLVKQHKELQEKNRSLNQDLTRDKELTEKTQTLLPLYEKLLIKLLHQRREIVSLVKYSNNNVNLQITSSQSIEYKNVEDIRLSVNTATEEVDSTYSKLHSTFTHSEKQLNQYEAFLTELSEFVEANMEDNDEEERADSCYSTENEAIETYLNGRDLHNGERGLKALKAKAITKNRVSNKFSTECLDKLLEKIKKIISVSRNTVILAQETQGKDRSRNAKQMQQLQRKLRKGKLVQKNLKNTLTHLRKETKTLKSRHFNLQQHQSPNRSPMHPPNKQQDTTVKFADILEELASTENEMNCIQKLLGACTDEESKQKLVNEFSTLEEKFKKITNKLRSFKCKCEVKDGKSSIDELEERFSDIKDQRQYMLEHLNFTNRRLEVLLDCLKGRESDENQNNEKSDTVKGDYNTFEEGNTTTAQGGLNTQPLLKRVRKSFDDDKKAMKKAVSILELTKAISITNLTELSEDTAIDSEHRDILVMVKDMNSNMESVLREARSKITSAKISKKSTNTEDTVSRNEIIPEEKHQSKKSDDQRHKHGYAPVYSSTDEYIPKSELLKKENELKTSLQNAQKKVENLSKFLENREEEIKKRDDIIAKLHKEYEQLKSDKTQDKSIIMRDRMIEEYAKVNQKLEKENEFLQLVVKELRDELMSLQNSFKKEEKTQQRLQEFINELQLCKSSLERSLDKVVCELNVIKQDRDHLVRNMYSMNSMYDPYQFYPQNSNAMVNPNMVQYPYNGHYYPECNNDGYSMAEYTESTTFGFSEDDWNSFCDECDSYNSDGEQDVISSSESATTSSRVAKNIKTEEATETIKSKNRPQKYNRKQETHSRKQLMSPNFSARSNYSQSDPFDGISLSSRANSLSTNSSKRVQGRREQQCGHKKSPRSPGRSPSLTTRSPNITARSTASMESNMTISSQRVNLPNSRDNSRPNSGIYGETYPTSFQPTHSTDIDSAVHSISGSQDNYYEQRRHSSSSKTPRDQLAVPFLNQSFEKKKKKKFLPSFGKK